MQIEAYPAGRVAVENGFANAFHQLRKNPRKYFGPHAVLSIDPVNLMHGRHSDILKAKVTFNAGSLNICMKRVTIRSDALEHRQMFGKKDRK